MLTVVGMGPAGLTLITPLASEAIKQAQVLVGAKRHLAQFPAFTGAQRQLDADIPQLLAWITAHRHKTLWCWLPATRFFTASARGWWPTLAAKT
jgi:precorrin-6Y C5,15-methyltransferase (decarboxylating) (EC 2.1.1.132)